MVRLTVVIALVALVVGCQQPNEPADHVLTNPAMAKAPRGFVPHATGEIEFEWKGGNGSGSPEITKYAFASLDAHMAGFGKPAKGEFRFWVQSVNDMGEIVVHRQIVAVVQEVKIGEYTPQPKDCEPTSTEAKVLAWFEGLVISDTKGCGGGSGPGGHEPGCPGSSGGGGCEDDADGGCSGDDGGHDEGCGGSGGSGGMGGEGGSEGGCSGHDGTEEGGCSGHDGTEEGGCSGHDGTEEGGCSGSGGSGGAGGPGGSGSAGNPASGKYCRVGQYVVVKVHDGGTPATNGDGIKWKWFASGAQRESLPDPGVFVEPKLCKKTILGGNLVIHLHPEDESPQIAVQQ